MYISTYQLVLGYYPTVTTLFIPMGIGIIVPVWGGLLHTQTLGLSLQPVGVVWRSSWWLGSCGSTTRRTSSSPVRLLRPVQTVPLESSKGRSNLNPIVQGLYPWKEGQVYVLIQVDKWNAQIPCSIHGVVSVFLQDVWTQIFWNNGTSSTQKVGFIGPKLNISYTNV